jgi:hypothetical protein
MNTAQVVIEQALPSEELLRRYPVLRNLKSTKLRMIEDALAEAASRHASQPDFAPSRFTDEEIHEAVEFYNHVVRDGRYVGILGTDPHGAAKLLDVKLSDKVKDILAYAKFIAPGVPVEDGGDYAIAIGISIVVSIVILVAVGRPRLQEEIEGKLVLLDRSGQIKL